MAAFPESAIEDAISDATKMMGYSRLTTKQEEVVKTFLKGRDVFVSLPTGSGKSLCYCILPFIFDLLKQVTGQSIAVVVSPLIALMKDQVQAMETRGVKAAYVGDCQDEKAVADVCKGRFQLVYISPESLLTDSRWRDMLLCPVFQNNLVALVAYHAYHLLSNLYVTSSY